MSSRPNDFKLGLFVLFGVVILVAALIIFEGAKMFQGKTVAETYIKGGVEGLKVGAPVVLRGVPVGQVTRINFTWNIYHQPEPRYVYVEFEVGNKVSLAPPGPQYGRLLEQEVGKGLRARIKTQGLATGNSIVSLEYLDPREYPPVQVPWSPQHYYVPSAPGQMSEILASLDQTIAAIRQINFAKIGQLAEKDLTAGGNLLHHANEMHLSELGTNLNSLVAEVRGIAGQFEQLVGPRGEPAETDLKKIMSHTDDLVARLQSTAGNLNGVVANLDTEALNQTLETLRQTAQELQQAISEIKQYPAGALLGRPPPPARSVERTKR